MQRRSILASPLALAACGGGGDAPLVAVRTSAIALYAHSVGTSYLQAQNAGGVERLAVPFARHLQDVTGRPVLDFSGIGATARGLIEGAPRMSIGPFEQHVQTVPAGVVLIMLGGVEAITGQLDDFGGYLGRMCDAALARDRLVVLVDQYRLAPFEARVDAINAAIDRVAAARNIPVAMTRDLPVTTADGTHPDSVLVDAIVQRVAQPLKGLL